MSTCPSLSELFAEKPSPTVAAHVAGCRRCQALLASEDDRVAVEVDEGGEWPLTDEEPAAGDVVLVAAPASDEYLAAVVAKVGDETVTAVPVSGEVEAASEWDLLLDQAVLGYQAMAEVWNFGTVLPEQLGERLAKVTAEVFEQLRQLLRAASTSGSVPAGVPVGVPIVGDDDPRLLFHDEEVERVHVFWEPTLALAGAANLAQLVAHRREELALAPEELESVSVTGEPGWLARLEGGELPIQRYLLPGTLAELMARLQIGVSRRLARIATWTLEEQAQSTRYATGSALARKRLGSSSSEQTVSEYVDEFMRELARHEQH
jgi:hypothetical protein